MRILFPYMARWYAVNWTRYHSLLYALADRGHEVTVLQPPRANLVETNFQDIAPVVHPRIELIDVPISSWLWERQWPLDKLVKRLAYGHAALSVARQLLRTRKFDAIVTYNIPQYSFMSLNIPVRVFDYADDYVSMLGTELGRLDNPLARLLATRLLDRMMDRATLVTSVSHELRKCASHEMAVLPNGVSLTKAAQAAERPLPETLAKGRPIVGYVGAFEYFIDWRCMIDAARLMPEVHFLLVGSGRDWNAARDYAVGCANLEFTGGVPHDRVFSYIRAMDVCMNLFQPIPVSHRACPIKLFEYLSMTKPVISTALDELKHIDTGILYFASDAADVVRQIGLILGDPAGAGERARRGRKLVAEHYEWDAIAQRFEALVGLKAGS